MSIKKIDDIPSSSSYTNQRQIIRADIEQAITNRISKFEMEGDYNYKYLNSYVKEELKHYFMRKIYSPVARRVIAELKKKLERENVFVANSVEEFPNFAKVHRVKGEDRIHVFVEIDFDFADNLYPYLLDKTEKRYRKLDEKKKDK